MASSLSTIYVRDFLLARLTSLRRATLMVTIHCRRLSRTFFLYIIGKVPSPKPLRGLVLATSPFGPFHWYSVHFSHWTTLHFPTHNGWASIPTQPIPHRRTIHHSSHWMNVPVGLHDTPCQWLGQRSLSTRGCDDSPHVALSGASWIRVRYHQWHTNGQSTILYLLTSTEGCG